MRGHWGCSGSSNPFHFVPIPPATYVSATKNPPFLLPFGRYLQHGMWVIITSSAAGPGVPWPVQQRSLLQNSRRNGTKPHVMIHSVAPGEPLFDSSACYRILLSGRLDSSWSDDLGGMHIILVDEPQHTPLTILMGRLGDQAALSGVLNAVFNLGLTLLSVERTDRLDAGASAASEQA